MPVRSIRTLAVGENGAGYIGLERRCEDQPFEYWIGMFTPEDTQAPEGFDYMDFPAVGLGTCWLYGKEEEIHDTGRCYEAVVNAGMSIWKDAKGGIWSFENCVCPRYTTPDEQGNIIMDYCYYVEE